MSVGSMRPAATMLAGLALWLAGAAPLGAGVPGGPHVDRVRFGLIEPPVVAQRDVTVRAPTSNTSLEELPLECSGMAWFEGHLLLTSDRHQHLIFTCPVDLGAMEIGRPGPHVVVPAEQLVLDDAECVTVRRSGSDPPMVYVLCSLSNDRNELPLPKRRHALRFPLRRVEPFRAGRPTVLSASEVRIALQTIFGEVGVRPYRTYYAEFPGPRKNTYRWGNVEGMAFTPDGGTLLCGMRNPLLQGRAILFAVEGTDEAFRQRDPGRFRVADVFTLDLGQRGVSDLAWDPVTKGYLIAAAKSNGPKRGRDEPFPPNTLESALFWWSGRKDEVPVRFADVPDMKVEAVCRLGETRYIAIGSDEGDVSEGRPGRQSVITVLTFTGVDRGR